MKKMIIIVAILAGVSATAQTVNGVQVADFNAEYIELMISTKMLSNKVMVAVDYGQPTKFIQSYKKMAILNKDGSKSIWNGDIDALNWFFHNGYELWSTYTVETSGLVTVHHILKRS